MSKEKPEKKKKPVKKVTKKVAPKGKLPKIDKDLLAAEVKKIFETVLGLDPKNIVVKVGGPVDLKQLKKDFLQEKVRYHKQMMGKSKFNKDQFLQEVMDNYEMVTRVLTQGPTSDEEMLLIQRILKYFLSDLSEKMVEKLMFEEHFKDRLSFLGKKSS